MPSELPILPKNLLFLRAAALTTVLVLPACAGLEEVTPKSGECAGKCDAVADSLADRSDPIATFLSAQPITAKGEVEVDYGDVVEGVAAELGCAADTQRTFVLTDDLLSSTAFPRLISTVCDPSQSEALNFFIAASFADPQNPDDVDLRNLEMFAWDEDTRQYNFYAVVPVSGTLGRLEVAPRRCEECHKTPSSLDALGMPMMPIMNELTRPWPHWNAEPDFPSHTFEVPDETLSAPNYAAQTAGNRLASASVLEQLIREAQSRRVVHTRARSRGDDADAEQAMALLRPLFCSEQVNYVTEDHQSGFLPRAAIIDPGLAEAFERLDPGSQPIWDWFHDDLINLGQPAADEETIAMLPVRGQADVTYEEKLMSVRALDPMDILRVRALDWKNPTFSSFRCGLWKEARTRLRDDPPAIDPTARNMDLFAMLLDEIMQYEGESLLTVDDDTLLVLADSESADAFKDALADGSIGSTSCTTLDDEFCTATSDELGDLLEQQFDMYAAGDARAMLAPSRIERLCRVVSDFPNRPAFPTPLCDGLTPNNARTADPASEVVAVTGAAAAVADDVLAIPDGSQAGITSTIHLDSGTPVAVGLVTVRVSIAHPWRGDLELELVGPQGQVFPLRSADPADSADNLDAAFAVDASLADGLGTWALRVVDTTSGQVGAVEAWSIGLNQLAPPLWEPGTRAPPGAF